MQLQIWHTGNSGEEPRVKRENPAKQGDEALLTPPDQFPVEGYGISLQQGLHWYMEQYMEFPTGDFELQANAILRGLRQWGQECFNRLFNNGGMGQTLYQQAGNGLQLKIVSQSDDPDILSWPWEALHSGAVNLALHRPMERQIAEIGDAEQLAGNFSDDQLNILYIIARPEGEDDVGFHTLVQPIIACAKKKNFAVHVDLLRPPTLSHLREVLEQNKGFYHIVHFDGHGVYDEGTQSGALFFETENDVDESFERVDAKALGVLLRENNIPVVALNACQSAMLDGHSRDAYASVATSLMRAGVRSVIAMSYSLWVSGARAFVTAFYEKMFAEGNIAEATRFGRKAMYQHKMRDSCVGKTEFQDWIVPVLYQNGSASEQILPRLSPGSADPDKMIPLPPEAQMDQYGLIGRDRAIQKLERLMRKMPAGILIHGMAGEGKTTLAKGFLQWLQDTNGLGNGAFWFSFEGLRGAEFIFSALSEALGLPLEAPLEQRLPVIVRILREHRFILVWDNFESASGIDGAGVEAQMPEEDRARLKKFLNDLYGGASKVLITSRSTEKWLSEGMLPPLVLPLQLDGLAGEELWEYCNKIADDLDLKLRRDAVYKDLMDELGGNPLAVRAILLRLPGRSAKAMLAEVRKSFAGLAGETDESARRIQSTLAVFEKGIDPAFAPILRLAGLHEMHIDADYLKGMLKQTAPGAVASLRACFAMLESAGLCHPRGNNIYKTHPALRVWLERLHPAAEDEQRAFVDFWGELADHYGPKELHEQRSAFGFYGANLRRALELAKALEMQAHTDALMQVFAVYALNNRNFDEAEKQYLAWAEWEKSIGDEKGVATAYHQLGRVAQERRDLVAAESWYRQSLEIKLKLGNELGAGKTYGQLGCIALEQRELEQAEKWYRQALDVMLKFKDDHLSAIVYHQLGRVAEERRDFDAAESWYWQSLAVKLKLGNESGAANTYHQLGMVAQERGAFDEAEASYKKALAIRQNLGEEYWAATDFHQLGVVAQERGAFAAAESWYKQALTIELKLGDEYGAASTYHQLGRVAEERGTFDAAESWYMQALAIFRRSNDPNNLAIAQRSLARIAKQKGE